MSATPNPDTRPAPPLLAWPMAIGGSAFAAGFFGPMIFVPDSNIGPIIGVLITGPAGVILGFALGGFAWALNVPATSRRQLLIAAAMLSALPVLAFCIAAPHPILRGKVIDAEIESCSAPVESAQDAIAYWDKRIAAVTWTQPRAGWKEAVPRLLQGGVVLQLRVQRQNSVYEQRKIWNRGQLRVSGWQPAEEPIKRYYARFAGDSCQDYPLGESAQYFPVDESSPGWPPSHAPSFLGLLPAQPVPTEIRELL